MTRCNERRVSMYELTLDNKRALDYCFCLSNTSLHVACLPFINIDIQICLYSSATKVNTVTVSTVTVTVQNRLKPEAAVVEVPS